MRLFIYFYFERNYDVLSQRVYAFYRAKVINFTKNETDNKSESKMTNPTNIFYPTHGFREMNL